MLHRSYSNRFRQAGMTLTESLLVLAIGAAVAVLAYGGYKMATGMVSVSSQTRAITQLAAAVKRVFGIATNYSTVSNANVINAKLVPEELRVSGTTIENRWGGQVTVSPGDQTGAGNTKFRIVITGVPSSDCVDFVSGLTSAAQTLWVNGTTAGTHDVKDASGVFHPDRASAQCSASSTATVTLVSQ